MIVLSRLTGWGLEDILRLTLDDIALWTGAATEVQRDINKGAPGRGR